MSGQHSQRTPETPSQIQHGIHIDLCWDAAAVCQVVAVLLHGYLSASVVQQMSMEPVLALCCKLSTCSCGLALIWLEFCENSARTIKSVAAEAKDDFFRRPTHQEEDVM